MTARLRRLRAEVVSDRDAVVAQLRTLSEVQLDGDRASSALAAWSIHHAYSAVESLLVRIARELEGGVPQGPDWHKVLLDDSALEIGGVRPPLFTRKLVGRLNELRAFRHFVRHGYAVELDAEELRRHQRRIASWQDALDEELAGLVAWLDALIAASD